MSDNSSRSPVDAETIMATMKFLGQQIRINQFRLKNQLRDKRKFDEAEAETKAAIECLKRKVRWEIDKHPDFFKQVKGLEEFE